VALPLLALLIVTSKLTGAGAQTLGASGFDLTYNLGEQGRSGCLVCHSDRNLERLSSGRLISFYIDQAMIARSAHRNVNCIGCHQDFSYSTHGRSKLDYRTIASLSCRSCHGAEWNLYQQGVHGKKGKQYPTCADCHGSHDIGLITKDPLARLRLHQSGYQVCGRCHQAYWSGYDDYYHGAAYKRGAPDAPSCWQCHRAHDIYPSKFIGSATNPSRIGSVCSVCHTGVQKQFSAYSTAVHGFARLRRTNLLYRTIVSQFNKGWDWAGVQFDRAGTWVVAQVSRSSQDASGSVEGSRSVDASQPVKGGSK
jgi:hypothetical protein